jgi:hypothetical protein
MLEIAEQICKRIADEIINKRQTVRQVFKRYMFTAEIDDEEEELIMP